MSDCVTIGDATLYLGDCLDILPTLSKVDAVITDPPYGIEVHAAGKRVKATGLSRVIISEALPFLPLTHEQRDALLTWCALNCRGWLLAFHQCEHSGDWQRAAIAAGLKYRRTMAWVKPDSPPQLSGDRPAQGFESIHASWCNYGGSVWNGGGKRGVFTHATRDDNDGKAHPTCKPIALMLDLVGLFSDEGDTVKDDFMGSGTTGVACMQLGRKFIGIEIERKYFDIACERIENAQRQVRMFA